MKSYERSAYFTRDMLMKLLSDDEVAKVSTAQTAIRLADGDEYVDLEYLEKGVQRALQFARVEPMGNVLARSAVQESTWTKIVALLKPVPTTNHSDASRS
jgi:hypothetical protein